MGHRARSSTIGRGLMCVRCSLSIRIRMQVLVAIGWGRRLGDIRRHPSKVVGICSLGWLGIQLGWRWRIVSVGIRMVLRTLVDLGNRRRRGWLLNGVSICRWFRLCFVYFSSTFTGLALLARFTKEVHFTPISSGPPSLVVGFIVTFGTKQTRCSSAVSSGWNIQLTVATCHTAHTQ